MMNRTGLAFFALTANAALCGEAPPTVGSFHPSAKDAFAPSAKDAFAPSAKDALAPSAKSSKAVSDLFVPPPATGGWTLGAGLNVRYFGAIDFESGVSNLTIPSLFQSGTTPVPGIGAPAGFVSRTYNDGFVRPDARTPARGGTTDYGYQNLNQLQGNTLRYNATGGERRDLTRDTSASSTGWSNDRDWEVAPSLKLVHHTDLGHGWSAGPAIHFSFAGIDGNRNGLNTISGSETLDFYDVSAADSYDTNGLSLPRQAPYVGAPNIVAPLLPAQPANRVLTETLRPADRQVATWLDSVSESLDVDTWSLSFGGEAAYQWSNRFYASVEAGFSLNVAAWDARRSDRLFQQVNNGPPVALGSSQASNSESAVLWGLYLQSAAGYRINERFSVEANLRYDLTESLNGSVGNSSFEVELSGFSAGIGATYSFW